MLIIGAPEVVLCSGFGVGVKSSPLVDEKNLPECASVISLIDGLELVDHRIANAIIYKEVAHGLANFFTQISGEPADPKKHKVFF